MGKIESNLIFAPLIRVSTEKQEKRGESLCVQRAYLESDIKSMGGKIVKWYAGQEHATPNYERKILDELLEDAKQKKIDAVIISDLDRWSRDNKRSAEDLNILIENDIRFFVRQQEYNLRNEHDYFFISLYSLMGRTQAYTQTRKSILSKISLAKQGIPSFGKLPYGRTYDRKTNQWGIDEKKKGIVEDAAKRYLSGESKDSIATSYNMYPANLLKLLKESCGDEWKNRLTCKRDRIDETVTIKIPRLLEEPVIRKIHERAKSNKTYNHGSYKRQYLLSGLIFDSATGYALTGTANTKGQRYYRPYQRRVEHHYIVNADVIETAFVDGFTDLLCHQDKWKAAAFDGDSIENRATKLKDDKEIKDKAIAAKKQEKERIEKRVLYCDDAEFAGVKEMGGERLKKLDEDITNLEFELDSISNQLKALPTQKEIEDTRKTLLTELTKRVDESYARSGMAFESLPFDEKKKLINEVFGGQDENGKKYGVYVKPSDGKPRKCQFKSYGRIGDILGSVKAKSRDYDSGAILSESRYVSS